jgi:hypothetical protein
MTMPAARPKGTLEDLDMLDKGIRATSTFYPPKDVLWQKARILGISRASFDAWAFDKKWFGSGKPPKCERCGCYPCGCNSGPA